MLKCFSTVALIMMMATTIMAQEPYPCGTGNYFSPWLKRYQENPISYRTNGDTLYLPIQLHIVGTDEGSGYYAPRFILESFCKLNADFAHTGIQFYMANDWNYINNSTYYDHDFQQGAQMMNFNNIPNAINCYVVLSPAGNCGYFMPSRDGIALNKGCMGGSSSTWAHEIGHYLSLPHPFVGWEGQEDVDYNEPAPNFIGNRQVERVDGSNCGNAADRFCDTAPDYLSFRWSCSSSDSSQVLQTDPNGETFRSDGSLIMSYSNDDCAQRFSEEQIDAMYANVYQERTDLLSDIACLPPIADYSALFLSPAEGEQVPDYTTVDLSWEDVPNATHYIVHVNFIPIFSGAIDEYVVDEPSITLTNLNPDRNYWWRVLPYNEFQTCTEYLDTSQFNTSLATNISILEQETDFQIYPNPLSSSDYLNMSFYLSESTSVSYRIFHPNGQLVKAEEMDLGSGRQLLKVGVENLPQNIYLLELNLPEGTLYKKLSIL